MDDKTNATNTQAGTWTVDREDIPGKIQLGRINKAVRALRVAGRGERILEGVHGRPETHAELLSISAMCSGVRNPLSIEKENEIGERYGWTVSRKNAAELAKALAAPLAEIEATIPTTDNRITEEEHAEQERERAAAAEKRRAEYEERERARKDSLAPIYAKRPLSARALIVAEYDEDASDIYTDYFAHTTTRYVAIGWRTGKREDFRQLRAAAARYPATAHLGPHAGDDVEHRENYSMGGGNYVKAGSRHSTGWKVRSWDLDENGELYGYGQYAIEDALPEAPAVEKGAGYDVIESRNKRGPFWLVISAARYDREQFEELRSRAKAAGGWYSRKWGGTPGGFGFSDRERAEVWAAENIGKGDA